MEGETTSLTQPGPSGSSAGVLPDSVRVWGVLLKAAIMMVTIATVVAAVVMVIVIAVVVIVV